MADKEKKTGAGFFKKRDKHTGDHETAVKEKAAKSWQKSRKAVSASAKAASTVLGEINWTNPLKSVGMKLFVAIFVSILACVLTVGLLAYSEARSMVEKKVSDASLQTVNQVTSNLDVIFKNYEDITLQILVDKDFHEIVTQIEENEDDYARFESTTKLNEKLQAISLGNETIKGISLLPLKESLPPLVSAGAQMSRLEALKQTEWYQKTIELDGRVNWIAPQATGMAVDGEGLTIGISRLLKDSLSSETSYMLLLEINASTIAERYQDVNLGENSELNIIDMTGNYVIANDKTLIGQPSRVSLPTEGEAAISGAETMKTTDDVEVLAVYKTLDAMDWRLVGTIPVGALVKDAETIRNLTWVTAIAAAILAIIIGIVVIVTIARPLVKICELMMEGARGNLTVRSTIKRQDEIGTLSVSFNGMMEQITELALQTTNSAQQVLITASDLTEASRKTSASAKEIAVATEEIANGATSLAVEAEKGNELTSNINAQMKQVMDANSEMVASASQVEKASEQGTTYMNGLILKTGMTEEMTRSMVEKVDSLKDSTGSIVKILDVLNNLTKQTNILSLNATIEAARAGTAGKGFMVVADEIRKLADQSRQSIDVVAQITEKIRSEIDETVHVLSDAYPLFQEQIQSVKEANEIFVSVQEQMGQFAERLEGVTSSIGRLDESQSILAEAMTNVSAVAEEASATSEEVASLSSEQLSISDNLVGLSEKLDAVSRGLSESLSRFKIN